MKNIQLNSTKNVTIVPQKQIESDKVALHHILDDPNKKVVIAFLSIGYSPVFKLELWIGADYDAIGNWTQQQAEKRIVDLL